MNKLTLLQETANSASNCTACELSKNRTKSVFSSGPIDAKIMLLGEAPGADEAIQGVPFVGRSGQLLNRVLVEAGIHRDEVYVANICKCRPPENRKPTTAEMTACSTFLEKQIEIVQPKIIVTLGATATEGICGFGVGITKRRGKFERYKNVPVLVSIHPSYVLRNPPVKAHLLADLKLAIEFANTEIG